MKSKKPVIGIVLDSQTDSAKYSYSEFPWYALRKDYANCVSDAGGVPIFLPHSHDIDVFLDMIDGLLIPGGDEDIHPKYYNHDIRSDKIKTNDIRAEFEIAITKQALQMNMPIFGICNGMQLINVIFGGTLIQHLPDVLQSSINHEQPSPKNAPTHDVIIEQNTLLHDILHMNKDEDGKVHDNVIHVNSTHHQAIGDLGSGLIISAKAPDGVIEAIESPDHKFVIGVEWHSEYLNSILDYNLFKKFIEACLK